MQYPDNKILVRVYYKLSPEKTGSYQTIQVDSECTVTLLYIATLITY